MRSESWSARITPGVIAAALILTACIQSPSSTPDTPVVAPATAAAAPTNSPSPKPTQAAQTSTATAPPSPTAIAPAPTASPGEASFPSYLDDRSTAISVVLSLYNAINRREYARAYAYWESADQLPPFEQYAQGYASTKTVELTIGTVTGDRGAGQIYYSVPVVLKAAMEDGSQQSFSGCYQLHLANPGIQADPPFHPLAIRTAQIQPAANGTDAQALLVAACEPAQPLPAGDPDGYIDNRSTAADVIRSLYNAINSKEYARAYSYWQSTAQLPAFATFVDGYANTQSVAVSFGQSSSGVGAGQIYYSLPTTINATLKDGSVQVFVGCYQLHLANPGIQTPPFQPLGITSATIQQATNGATTMPSC